MKHRGRWLIINKNRRLGRKGLRYFRTLRDRGGAGDLGGFIFIDYSRVGPGRRFDGSFNGARL